jgi:hypothetical protein
MLSVKYTASQDVQQDFAIRITDVDVTVRSAILTH